MKVAVVHELGHPLVVDERSTPIPGAGQVLVKLEASGLCHTDIHAAHGDWPVKPEPPFVPGHEGVGIVHAHGPGVADAVLGTRVGGAVVAHGVRTLRALRVRLGNAVPRTAEHRLHRRRVLRQLRASPMRTSSCGCPRASIRSKRHR